MVVIGAGGHALEVLDILIQDNYRKNIYFYDDVNPDNVVFRGFQVFKSEIELKTVFQNNFDFCLGIGNPKARRALYERFKAIGGELQSIISSKAILPQEKTSLIFDVMNLCYLGPETSIGLGTLLNTGSQIHHEVKIGQFTEISPRTLLLGKVQVGDNCSLGGNCTVLPKVKIGNNVTVGAGSVVTKDVPDGKTVVGVPARIIEKIR